MDFFSNESFSLKMLLRIDYLGKKLIRKAILKDTPIIGCGNRVVIPEVPVTPKGDSVILSYQCAYHIETYSEILILYL